MEEFAKERMAICKNCPIVKYEDGLGWKCDSRKWVSPDGKEGSLFFKEGWTKGCGCLLKFKIQNESNHCPAKFW